MLRVTPVVQADASKTLSRVARKCNDLLEAIGKNTKRGTMLQQSKPRSHIALKRDATLQRLQEEASKTTEGGRDDGGEKRRRDEISADPGATGVVGSSAFQSKLEVKDAETTALLSHVVQTNLLFSGLGSDEAADVINAFEKTKFEAGVNVISQGEEGDDFFVVDSGSLTVEFQMFGYTTPCREIYSGDSFGEMSLLYNIPRAATVTTITGCVLWSLCRTTYKAIIGYHKQKRMQNVIQLFTNVEVLSNLNEREVALIADASEQATFEADTTIMRQVRINQHLSLRPFGGGRHCMTFFICIVGHLYQRGSLEMIFTSSWMARSVFR
jgi:CRP-like cAMP-binding protein